MQIRLMLLAFTFMLTHQVAVAETTESPSSSVDTPRGRSDPDAENTRLNVRDKGDATVTPEEQGEQPADREITATIRRAVVEDDSLSLNAHNVKIVTRDGGVTLRGPVDSKTERAKIAKLAEQTVGVKRVDNQLEVDVD